MERITDLIEARKIAKDNLIGPEELCEKRCELGISIDNRYLTQPPPVPYPKEILEQLKYDYILIFGANFHDGSNLNIVKLRSHFGLDPDVSEPCFYNQDWYIKDAFANDRYLENKWYLIRKNPYNNARGKELKEIDRMAAKTKRYLPSAILATYVFFANYFINNGDILWKYDYIWCSDTDDNGDRIYLGRYLDPRGKNKNGFNIHRFLTINRLYTYVDIIK